MRVKIIARQTIKAPPAKVFRYLTHLKYHQLWNPHLQTITPITVLRKDTIYKTTSMMLGVRIGGTNHVVSCTKDQELEIDNNAGTLHYKVAYHLQPAGDTTQLVCTTIVSTDNQAFAFTIPVLKLLARRELQSDLRALKIAVEQNLT